VGKARGYTLIELLVVLAVMAVLAVAVRPLAEMSLQRERERELKRALWEIRDAIDAYKRAVDEGLVPKPPGGTGYPERLEQLAQGVPNTKQPGQMLYFLRRLPRDPFADPALPAAQTWGLRAYAAPPQRPVAGVDVYDVYSRAEGLALNGVPLREW